MTMPWSRRRNARFRRSAVRWILLALGCGCSGISFRSLLASLSPCCTNNDTDYQKRIGAPTNTGSFDDEIEEAPSLLRRGILVFLRQRQREERQYSNYSVHQFASLRRNRTKQVDFSRTSFYDAAFSSFHVPPSILFWNVIEQYSSSSYTTSSVGRNESSLQTACTDPPGLGWEGSINAYRLLTQKIRLYSPPSSPSLHPAPKILCAVYTHPPMHALVRMAALTWGVDCYGWLALSTKDDPSLGIIALPHQGPESYANMWQKTRAIWKYIYTNHASSYDYVHLSGDDVYLLVPNLKHFLQQNEEKILTTAEGPVSVFAGQWIRQRHRPYVGGGPGYTLSRHALLRYMQIWDTCYPNVTSSAEDRYLSLCMKAAQVPLTDTRDFETGEQTYHDCPPQQVFEGRSVSSKKPNFHTRAVAYWETLPHPRTSGLLTELWRPVSLEKEATMGNTTPEPVGPKYGNDAAAQYSIAFHKIHHPLFMLRMHALLHPNICLLEL